jgi:hypothetical protein
MYRESGQPSHRAYLIQINDDIKHHTIQLHPAPPQETAAAATAAASAAAGRREQPGKPVKKKKTSLTMANQ